MVASLSYSSGLELDDAVAVSFSSFFLQILRQCCVPAFFEFADDFEVSAAKIASVRLIFDSKGDGEIFDIESRMVQLTQCPLRPGSLNQTHHQTVIELLFDDWSTSSILTPLVHCFAVSSTR